MYLDCSYFYNGWEAFFATSSFNCCKVWLSWPSGIICVLPINLFCNYFSVPLLFLHKIFILSQKGLLRFVLSLFLSFGQIWGWCSYKIALINKKEGTSAKFQLYMKSQTKLNDSIFLPSTLERKVSHPDDR